MQPKVASVFGFLWVGWGSFGFDQNSPLLGARRSFEASSSSVTVQERD